LHPLGLTRARTIGPMVREVERAGASVARVFRNAGLPLRLIERPDALMLLRDQLKLVECAAQAIGDAALPARLSVAAGSAGLGAYGASFAALPRLDLAIARADETMTTLLQSATRLRLTLHAGRARWTYTVTDPTAQAGRQKNELLALGYMLDMLRRFLGRGWVPARAAVPGAALPDRPAVESALGCELGRAEVALIEFPADALDATNPVPWAAPLDAAQLPPVPAADDLLACLEHLVALELLEARPSLDMLSRRLGLTRRTLQRRLTERGTDYAGLMRRVLLEQACAMLRQADWPITDVAYELGYADAAHFTRAFRTWVGEAPLAWRRRMLGRS